MTCRRQQKIKYTFRYVECQTVTWHFHKGNGQMHLVYNFLILFES